MIEQARAEHPTGAELAEYQEGNLPDFVQAWIEEHMEACDLCAESMRRVQSACSVLDGWTASAHGEANLRTRVAGALAKVESQALSPDLREHLREWNIKWQGRVSGALRVVVDAAGVGSQLIAEGMEGLLCPEARMPAFAVSSGQPTRGQVASAPIFADTAAVPGNPPTHVVLMGSNLRVTVGALLPGQKAPVVVLIPEDMETPQAQRLVRDHRSPTPSWVADFPSVPAGPYTLTFLWF